VLTPFIPSGSKFLLKFTPAPPLKTIYQYASEAPDSPSRAPSPCDSTNDLTHFSLLSPSVSANQVPFSAMENTTERKSIHLADERRSIYPAETVVDDTFSSKSRQNVKIKHVSHRHVVFVMANYFVLFISLIAISAEIHERSPQWMDWLENNINQVHNCAIDQDALFKCVSEGDFRGLVASIFLWLTSKTNTSLFLFGFDSVQKLWTVVYEAVVTGLCWGTSYLFVRRGLNPDTRARFLEKYWKDCAYGSLAGFYASFMKAVLKNLIPKEVIEDMTEDIHRLKIVDWILKIVK